MEEPAQVKVCSKCKIEKEFSEFSIDNSKKDLLRHQCKECDIIKNKNYYSKHQKDIAEYYKNNIDRVTRVHTLYRRGNKDKIHCRGREYNQYQKNNPLFVDKPQLWYLNAIKRNARKRKNCQFNLTYQELLDSNNSHNCCFCGVKLRFVESSSQAPGNQNASLDRIDSSRGYEVGNIQWSCWDCNQLKGPINDNKFIQLCNNIAITNPRPYLAC